MTNEAAARHSDPVAVYDRMREVATQLRGRYYAQISKDPTDPRRAETKAKMRNVTDRIRATDPDDLDAVDTLREEFHAELKRIHAA